MTQMRWKRRRKAWVGFLGSSRAAKVSKRGKRWEARVLVGPYVLRYLHVDWWNAPTLTAAQTWCARHLRAMPDVDLREAPAYLIFADGKIEERAPYGPNIEFDRIKPLRALFTDNDVSPFSVPPYERVVCPGQLWSQNFSDPYRGVYGDARVLIYVEPGSDDRKVKSLAEEVLRRRAWHMGIL